MYHVIANADEPTLPKTRGKKAKTYYLSAMACRVGGEANWTTDPARRDAFLTEKSATIVATRMGATRYRIEKTWWVR